mmetsp:Transcript_574/g.1466  ORF Transcript_574/g.1466 Transcript_574/m.1466 type:complete len:521 (-) Transcript_574:92-1654(-)|eukprot:CAMPEP_0113452782 /NCGR_PEP_ID=MMETSP0014_2-20120614/7021_1 /TAXON_ID=2857 /ORGANISM="Nitzschia sp." /LENGTH=520 /DNA_ID=CAMNT_0000344159 /DNA_START=142 /DNA_END=1704 /DNA_ORIENTATION=- /assembly_acc=CAM_ASM_000159
MSPPGGATSNGGDVHDNGSAEVDAANDDTRVDFNGQNIREDHGRGGDDGDDEEGNRSEEGSDPVMVSPSSSPQRVDSPLQSDCGEEEGEEKFVDTVQVVDDNDDGDGRNNDGGKQPKGQQAAAAAVVPSFVSTGLAQKASPLKVKSWIACALTLDGRDKITKLFQYLSRLLAWWYLTYRHDKVRSAKFTGLFKTLSSSRKAFRLGRFFIELDKLQSMGLLSMAVWYIQNHLDRLEGKVVPEGSDEECDESSSSRPWPKILVRRASSNIGWGPMTTDDDVTAASSDNKNNKKSLTRSFSNMAYRKMYRPLLSRMSSRFGGSTVSAPSTEWWKVVGSALKIVGLFGFWVGDNVNFVAGSGALDNYQLTNKDRLGRRKKWQTLASENANRAYFLGSVAGLATNAYAYYRFCKDVVVKADQEYQEALAGGGGGGGDDDTDSIDREEQIHSLQTLKRVQQKQFSLFLALLKSCVDVTVFSNNAGIDLHKKFRGKKNHEGLHCVCGLISASTVLYNNFPDASKLKK